MLGAPRFAATRINLAQSCNGLGWIFGPPLGGMFFYSKDAAGHSTGSQTLYIPYVALAIGAMLIAVVFYFANVPDIKMKDEYHLDETRAGGCRSRSGRIRISCWRWRRSSFMWRRRRGSSASSSTT